jgi:hypothetical protein
MQNNERYNRVNTAKWISIRTTLLSADWPPNCFIIWLFLVAVERVSRACMAKTARRNVVASTAANVARRTADVTAWQDSLGIYASASVRQWHMGWTVRRDATRVPRVKCHPVITWPANASVCPVTMVTIVRTNARRDSMVRNARWNVTVRTAHLVITWTARVSVRKGLLARNVSGRVPKEDLDIIVKVCTHPWEFCHLHFTLHWLIYFFNVSCRCLSLRKRCSLRQSERKLRMPARFHWYPVHGPVSRSPVGFRMPEQVLVRVEPDHEMSRW